MYPFLSLDRETLYLASGDLGNCLRSVPWILLDILPSFVPYTLVLASFGAFVVWNGGIVLGMHRIGIFYCG